MRQRITLLHKPEDAIDPESITVTDNSLSLSGLEAAREDRITFSLEDLPQEISLVLKQAHELHIRYVNRVSYDSVSPLLARLSPGLHVYFTPQRKVSNADLLCSLLNKIFSPTPKELCQTPEKSFTSLPMHRFQHSTAYEYYLPHSYHNKFALVDYILQACPLSDKTCRARAERLRDADYIDIDYNTISHAVHLISYWSSQTWELSVSSTGPNDRLEVGVLSNEKPVEPEELNLAGFLTVVGEDTKPSPTMFAFPARHHPHSSFFSSTPIHPTGLHPSLQLSISDSKPPTHDRTCSLHAYLTLPRVIFADKYQLSDQLFLASKNISQIHHITVPVDLEAPEYVMSLWGSSLLLELSPPPPKSSAPQPWTAEIPLHLRYLLPSATGHINVSIPSPVLFWACTSEEGTKFNINPFDRVNLGYDGLFGPRTMFYHLTPVEAMSGSRESRAEKPVRARSSAEARQAIGSDGYLAVQVPVLNLKYADWIEPVTASVVLLGFGWVMWKILVVWRTVGYGRIREADGDKKEAKKRQ